MAHDPKHAAMFTSNRDSWNTPPIVFDALAPLIGSRGIVLDPCSNRRSVVGARVTYSLAAKDPARRDGLRADWLVHARRGLVFVNPPYGEQIQQWISKCVVEASRGVEIVALVPARVDTVWWNVATLGIKLGMAKVFATRDSAAGSERDWHRMAPAARVLFWKGRLRFLGASNSAPFPVALLYWGGRPEVFATVNASASAGALDRFLARDCVQSPARSRGKRPR